MKKEFSYGGYMPQGTTEAGNPPNCDSGVMLPGVDLEKIGYMTGVAMQQFFRGFWAGIADAANSDPVLDAAGNTETVQRDRKPPKGKTDISDCRACWCDSCANIEICDCKLDICGALTHVRSEATITFNQHRPFPCWGCEDGERTQPTEAPATCGAYIAGAGPNNG